MHNAARDAPCLWDAQNTPRAMAIAYSVGHRRECGSPCGGSSGGSSFLRLFLFRVFGFWSFSFQSLLSRLCLNPQSHNRTTQHTQTAQNRKQTAPGQAPWPRTRQKERPRNRPLRPTNHKAPRGAPVAHRSLTAHRLAHRLARFARCSSSSFAVVTVSALK